MTSWLKKFDPAKLSYGYNTVDGEEIYFIPNPALGLWINREAFEGSLTHPIPLAAKTTGRRNGLKKARSAAE